MPGKSFFITSVLVLELCSSALLFAQDVFVKDSLRVGVRSEPGNVATPISVVTTGMKLLVLESSGNYVKIKSESGLVGWVKKTYVSPEPPAQVHLQQLQEKYKKLDSDLTRQTNVVRAAELNVKTLSEEITQLKKNNAELRVQLKDERNENSATHFTYLWKIALFLLVCVIGFGGGVLWHRNYAMKRLGGLRV